MSGSFHFSELVLYTPEEKFDGSAHSFSAYRAAEFDALCGSELTFCQENHSCSRRGVLRGLHYQIKQPQGKLLRVVAGAVFDVAVDVRASSPSFGRWSGVEMSAANRLQRWIPPGFAHGFLVLGEFAEVVYKTTTYWAPEHERAILWNDPAIGIDWPLDRPPQLSGKDQAGKLLAEAEVFA
jgi:dTDP-4-dehydrorhamnose 3,5-epimerase